jgi:hypothetical protein
VCSGVQARQTNGDFICTRVMSFFFSLSGVTPDNFVVHVWDLGLFVWDSFQCVLTFRRVRLVKPTTYAPQDCILCGYQCDDY